MYMQQKQDRSGMCEVVLELLSPGRHLWNELVYVHAAKDMCEVVLELYHLRDVISDRR